MADPEACGAVANRPGRRQCLRGRRAVWRTQTVPPRAPPWIAVPLRSIEGGLSSQPPLPGGGRSSWRPASTISWVFNTDCSTAVPIIDRSPTQCAEAWCSAVKACSSGVGVTWTVLDLVRPDTSTGDTGGVDNDNDGGVDDASGIAALPA